MASIPAAPAGAWQKGFLPWNTTPARWSFFCAGQPWRIVCGFSFLYAATLHAGGLPAGLFALAPAWAWADEATKRWCRGRHFSWADVTRNLAGVPFGAGAFCGAVRAACPVTAGHRPLSSLYPYIRSEVQHAGDLYHPDPPLSSWQCTGRCRRYRLHRIAVSAGCGRRP